MRTEKLAVQGINYILKIFGEEDSDCDIHQVKQIKAIVDRIADTFSMFRLLVDAERDSLLEEWTIRVRWNVHGRRLGIDLRVEFLQLQSSSVQIANEMLSEMQTALNALNALKTSNQNDRN